MEFESHETVTGRVRGADEWIEYHAVLRVKDSGKTPVSIQLTFVPPHPFTVNLPEQKVIRAESIAKAFSDIVRFLDGFGIDFEC